MLNLDVKDLARVMLILKKPFSGTANMHLHIRPMPDSTTYLSVCATALGAGIVASLAVKGNALEVGEPIVFDWRDLDYKLKALKKAKIASVQVSSRKVSYEENGAHIHLRVATLAHERGSYELPDLQDKPLGILDPEICDRDRAEQDDVAMLFADELPELAVLSPISSSDGQRININGVWITSDSLMATDGHRMLKFARENAKDLDGYENVMLPSEVADALAYAHDKGVTGPDVWIYEDEDTHTATTGDYAISWKTPDIGRHGMPDYTQIIYPWDSFRAQIELDVDALEDAVALIAPAVNKTNAVILSPPDDDRLRFSAQDAGTLTSSEVFADCTTHVLTSKAERVRLNVDYLSDAIKTLTRHGSERIEIAFTDTKTPLLLRAVDRPGDVHVVMPMQF